MAASCMSEKFQQHIPVLLNETLSHLINSPDGIYVDATFGRGSHSQAILDRLSPQGRLIAFDRDPEAVAYARKHFNDPRFTIFHTPFSRLEFTLTGLQVFGNVSGILFDLGVSSPQLDTPDRGFSFMHAGNLDMRMDTSRGVSAKEWLAKVSEEELATVLWKYGEERFSRRIACAIVTARTTTEIANTAELSDIIKRAVPKAKRNEDKHPATRSFQAIRIAVNDELKELEQGLTQSLNALRLGGRLAVISFHSLEDRIVKQFIRAHEKGEAVPRGLPIKASQFKSRLKAVGKAIKPSLQEININPRARSAILRIAEKQS